MFPLAPTNLLAAATNAQARLNWSAVTNATGYNLKRSLMSGGPYAPVTQPQPPLAPVLLMVTVVANQFQFSWPLDHTGWRMQMPTNSPGTSWLTIPGADATNLILLPMTNPSAFFRLVYP